MREALPHNLQTECASHTSDTSCSAFQKAIRSAILASAFVFPYEKGEAEDNPQEQAQATIQWLQKNNEIQLLFALEDKNYFVRKFASEELKRRAIQQMRTTKRHIEWEKYLGKGDDPERELREKILKKEILPEQMWMGSFISEDFPEELIKKPMSLHECADHFTRYTDNLVQCQKDYTMEKVIIQKDISGMSFLEACANIQSEDGRQVFLRDQKNGIAKLGILKTSNTKRLAYDNGLSARMSNCGKMQYIFLTAEGKVHLKDWELIEAKGIGSNGSFPLMLNRNYEKNNTFIGLDLPTASGDFEHIDIRLRIAVKGQPFLVKREIYPLHNLMYVANDNQEISVIQGEEINDKERTQYWMQSWYTSANYHCGNPVKPEDDDFSFIAQRKDKTIIKPSGSLRQYYDATVSMKKGYTEQPYTIAVIITDNTIEYESEKVLEFKNVPLYKRELDGALQFTDTPTPKEVLEE